MCSLAGCTEPHFKASTPTSLSISLFPLSNPSARQPILSAIAPAAPSTMVPIIAPSPRPAYTKCLSRTAPRTPAQPTDPSDDPFYVVPDSRPLKSPPQLLSPFRLPEDAGRSKLSKPAPCSPTKRRRGLSSNLSRSGRRRHNPRSECCISNFPRPPTSLDDLPWISALTIEPDLTDPWDIADLSLLNADWQAMRDGPGPVRRRKTSLRSDPLAPSTPTRNASPSPAPFPFVSLDDTLQTPAPRPYPPTSDVIFKGLYPIFPEDIDYPSRPADSQLSP
ncbi:hypothetical protein C8Q77DRAFT_534811 [Trametes polyzona]|nr:hypothetical protein C8Q77DRAFT_534811 [Trametes polyzona]